MLKWTHLWTRSGRAELQNEFWSIGSMTRGQHSPLDRAQASCTSFAKEVNAT